MGRRVRFGWMAGLFLLIAGYAVWMGLPGEAAAAAYPVKGVDVSAYQGEIDWAVLSDGLDFAFIKATEGSGYTDPMFRQNLEGALDARLRVGAYHFFSFDSSWDAQAAHFISVVPADERLLPPVVDVELYGAHRSHPPEPDAVRASLELLLGELEAHYGKRPILYATGRSYRLYLQGAFREYPIWIRDVHLPPSLPDGRGWLFWQYSDRARLPGYSGPESRIDRNVFCGSPEEFSRL